MRSVLAENLLAAAEQILRRAARYIVKAVSSQGYSLAQRDSDSSIILAAAGRSFAWSNCRNCRSALASPRPLSIALVSTIRRKWPLGYLIARTIDGNRCSTW